MAAIRRSVIDPGEKTGENTNVGKQANARWVALPRGEKVLQIPGARTIASPQRSQGMYGQDSNHRQGSRDWKSLKLAAFNLRAWPYQKTAFNELEIDNQDSSEQ